MRWYDMGVLLLAHLAMLGATDGGVSAPVEYSGTLERHVRYVLVGEHDPERGLRLLDAFVPPRLKLPFHHAGRLEWSDAQRLEKLPIGRVRLVFVVEEVVVERMTERRWNSTFRCRLESVDGPAP